MLRDKKVGEVKTSSLQTRGDKMGEVNNIKQGQGKGKKGLVKAEDSMMVAKPDDAMVRSGYDVVYEYLKEREQESYEVEGKVIPGAGAILSKAGDISIEIVKSKYEGDIVEVIVRAVRSDGVYKDDWVVIDFINHAKLLYLQKIEKRVKEMRMRGKKEEDIRQFIMDNFEVVVRGGVPKDGILAMSWFKNLLQSREFATRLAVTKASRRAVLHLLKVDYLEDFEREDERMEVELIRGEREDKVVDKREDKVVDNVKGEVDKNLERVRDEMEFKKFRVQVAKIIKAVNLPDEEYRRALMEFCGVESSSDIPKERRDEFIKFIAEYCVNYKARSREDKQEEGSNDLVF